MQCLFVPAYFQGKKKENQTLHSLPSPHLQNMKPSLPLHLSPSTTLCFQPTLLVLASGKLSRIAQRGPGCLHFSSSLYHTICHVSRQESEFGCSTHPARSHRHPQCAPNGSDFANDIAFADDRCRPEQGGSHPQPAHRIGLPANPSAINQS